MSLRLFSHVLILDGAAVGGGSITYAQTLLAPPDSVWSEGEWAGLDDWRAVMPMHYATAKRMLGVTRNRRPAAADFKLRDMATAAGVDDSFYLTDVGVFFGNDKDPPGERQAAARTMLGKIGALPERLGAAETLLADAGYFSAAKVEACRQAELEPLIAMGRQPHHPPLGERFGTEGPPPENPTPVEAMAPRLKTPEGRRLYALRKQTPEPVFGVIKSALGFRQFSFVRVPSRPFRWPSRAHAAPGRGRASPPSVGLSRIVT